MTTSTSHPRRPASLPPPRPSRVQAGGAATRAGNAARRARDDVAGRRARAFDLFDGGDGDRQYGRRRGGNSGCAGVRRLVVPFVHGSGGIVPALGPASDRLEGAPGREGPVTRQKEVRDASPTVGGIPGGMPPAASGLRIEDRPKPRQGCCRRDARRGGLNWMMPAFTDLAPSF